MIVLLDVDGTLIDTNYHHALAWYRAFQRFGVTLELVDLHRRMGMGGDQLVGDVAGEDFDRERGDDVRAAEKEEYGALIDEVTPLGGARELIEDLRGRGCTVVLASSAKQEEVEHYLGLLGVEGLAYTTSSDVEQTKPQPDLVHAALEKAGAQDGSAAVMIGDSTWDCEASKRAGVPCYGVLTGGFSREELAEAGAVESWTKLADLRRDLDRVLTADTTA
jgi:HAD superfamily hydrolase (TIGR01509 family)